jgi:hypothetical protein
MKPVWLTAGTFFFRSILIDRIFIFFILLELFFYIRSGHTCVLTNERKAFLWGAGSDYCINPVSMEDTLLPTELVCAI